MTRTEMEMEEAMKNYYETEFNEAVADMPEYPDAETMDAEMAAIAEAEAAEMEAAEQEFEAARAAFEKEAEEEAEREEARQDKQYEALVFAKFCEEQDKIEDDLRREMERTAGKYFDHVAVSGA